MIISNKIKLINALLISSLGTAFAADPVVNPDQTVDYTNVSPAESLNYSLQVKRIDTPEDLSKLQSFTSAQADNTWLLFGGLTEGKHIFTSRNTKAYAYDLSTKKVYSKELTTANTGLTQQQIDALLSTNSQSYQDSDNLYVIGGYGITNDEYNTYDSLSRVKVNDFIAWIENSDADSILPKNVVSQIDSKDTVDNTGFFQITGGSLQKLDNGNFALIFGHTYKGPYKSDDPSVDIEQIYNPHVRVFNINDTGTSLSYDKVKVTDADDNFKRRDLNIVPSVKCTANDCTDDTLEFSSIALSGVFTPDTGVWTKPVFIDSEGNPSQDTTDFKQAMNNYETATLSLFSKSHKEYSSLLFGGITRNTYDPASKTLTWDESIPNTSEITVYTKDKDGQQSQSYVTSFPDDIYIEGNVSKFGSNSEFFVDSNIKTFKNGIVDQDALDVQIYANGGEVTLGYVYGGIEASEGGKPRDGSDKLFKVTYGAQK